MSSDLGVIWRGILARGACCKLVLRLLCAYNNHILFTSRGCFSSAWTAPSASALTLNKPRNIDRSHSAPMRAAAAAALLQFLLDYPLGSGRLRGHVQFLLSNTAYEHESGRLQALEMLQQVRACACQGARGGMQARARANTRCRRRAAGMRCACWKPSA